jgi:hypothetical protein
MSNKIIDLILKSKFKYDDCIKYKDIYEKKTDIIQTGIGDILLNILLIENNIKQSPLYFNISIYIKNPYSFNNTLNSFKFKLNLLEKICKNNDIIFYNDKNIEYNCEYKLNKIINFKSLHKYFNFNNSFDTEYIVFHTKCRFINKFNYNNLKQNLKLFYKTFKSKYKIIILGEKQMPSNSETNCHKITTIYDELLELKNNNDVLDLSIDNIYDNLDFNNYCKDMAIIHNAKTNIIVGNGGHYCNSIIFGNGLIVYTIPECIGNFNIDLFKKNYNYVYFDINMFFKKLNDINI